MDDDRISQLPEPILQNHILSFLLQKDAVRTCLLSKSWRHLGPTRPKIEFDERSFRGGREKFLSVVEKTLQKYVDQKLSIQEFIFTIWGSNDSESISLFNKWITIVITILGVKKFKLTANLFPLPWVVLQSEFLEDLYLHSCELNYQINNNCIVKLHMLKRLSIHFVCVDEETFEKILSSCPLIEHLVFHLCYGVSTLRVNKARNLKHFDSRVKSVEIDDAPSLETISLKECENWNHHHNNFFPHLKSVYMWYVHLGTDSFDRFSNNCPCLEELVLDNCPGFTEFKLSSRSIKRLIIKINDHADRQIEGIVDAANMLYFEFRSYFLPSISFATTSREWESRIHVGCFSKSSADVLSTWPLKLYEFLKALSQSQISLDISFLPLRFQDTKDDVGSCDQPVVVEHLCLSECESPSAVLVLLHCLLRKCRPRYIVLPFSANSLKLAESICKTLSKKGKTRQWNSWKQDLEESRIQVLDKNANEWRPGQVCALSYNNNILFTLKWRDLS